MVDCDRGPMGSESPRQDAPSPLFFLRASSLSLGSSFASEGCWLVLKRWQFFTHSSLWSSSIVLCDASSPKGNLCFPLPPWNAQGRNHHFLFFIPETKEFIIYLWDNGAAYPLKLQMLAPHSCLRGSAWFHLLGRVINPETPSSGVEGGFLAPRRSREREWVRDELGT